MQNLDRGQPKKWHKIAAMAICGVIMFFIVTSLLEDKTSASGSNPKASEFSEVIAVKDIEVTSVSVKPVESKYDYWFSIRNNTKGEFSGTVYIALLDRQGKEITSDTFTTKSALSPSLGQSVKVSAHTSPSQGIVGYRYWVKENNLIIKNGSSTLASIVE